MNFETYIDQLVDRSQDAIKANEGDFVDEDTGLLMCGKCHTPKQTRFTIMGKVRTPLCLCKCAAEKRDADEAEQKRIEFEKRVDKLRKEGFPDIRMRTWNFANDDLGNPKLTRAMQRYADGFSEFLKSGQGLLLYGNCGTGKTYAACEVANALIDRGYRAVVVNFSRVLNTLQGTFEKQAYIDQIVDCHILVIDDLGVERSTEYAKEQVYNVIDARYRDGRPMIITTNMNLDKMRNDNALDNYRTYERILERCFPINVSGRSRRINAAASAQADMKNRLGL